MSNIRALWRDKYIVVRAEDKNKMQVAQNTSCMTISGELFCTWG